MYKLLLLLALGATHLADAYYTSRVGTTYDQDLNQNIPRESLTDIARVNDKATLQDVLSQAPTSFRGENEIPKYRRLR